MAVDGQYRPVGLSSAKSSERQSKLCDGAHSSLLKALEALRCLTACDHGGTSQHWAD